jgi:energy-coupling factor transporter ATP-binding protein EcfA2
MEFSGRPLFDNPLDAALFVPRPEVEQLERNSAQGINTLVLGEPGSGKTSLLRHVLFLLRESGRDPLWVDGSFADNILDLLRLIEEGVREIRGGEGGPRALSPSDSSESAALAAVMRGLRSELQGERLVAFLDLAPGGVDPHALFGRYRDQLWQTPLTWIVAAPTTMRAALTTPPADAFFEDVVELGLLTLEQQQDLVQRRLERGETTPWRLGQEGEGNPRRLLQILRDTVRTGEPLDAHLLARSIRDGELAALGHSARVVYEYLEQYGPTSASDGAFLESLNWSRQRGARVLSELEEAGLVQSEAGPGEYGRPRKLFAVVPPTP